ncbi:MAG TPA: UDP-4-amino-4,6-dideoxy-N-acetyl-beta-L-altrosamine transaminase [Methylophilaceae bacterium]
MTIQKIPYGRHFIDEADVAAVVDVLRHGAITQGPKIAEFEKAVAEYVGAKYAVAVSNGTAALHLACLAAGIGPGDNVVTTPNTFVASANCALYVGANPQFADIDAQTLNMDPAALQDKCRKLGKVKAIIPVHFGGVPCDMPAIKQVADQYGAIIIEDASHALGASYPQGGKVGNCAYAQMTVFSFHPVKIIAAGEGGMITTNDAELYRKLLKLRSHGINKLDDGFLNNDLALDNGEANPWYYEMQDIGYNYRITDIQSALALSQLGKLKQFLARRLEVALNYDQAFKGMEFLTLPQQAGRPYSAHHLYVLRIDFAKLGKSRRVVMNELLAAGVGTQVHYIPVHLHPYYQKLGHKPGDYPVAESYYREALSIPQFFGLTASDQALVINKVTEVCA